MAPEVSRSLARWGASSERWCTKAYATPAACAAPRHAALLLHNAFLTRTAAPGAQEDVPAVTAWQVLVATSLMASFTRCGCVPLWRRACLSRGPRIYRSQGGIHGGLRRFCA